jgi:AcrR family transcriptional regulator
LEHLSPYVLNANPNALRDTRAIAAAPDTEGPRRGRPAAVSPAAVTALALHRYLRGRRIDVRAIAAELGVGRTTIYRWFGTREELVGTIVARAAEDVLAAIDATTKGRGAERLLEVFDRFNRALADAPALRSFLEQERDTALRIITSSEGTVTPRMVDRIGEIIAREVDAGAYEPPVEIETLALAMVRLAEAFIFNDVRAGIRGEVDRLRAIEAALLRAPRGA